MIKQGVPFSIEQFRKDGYSGPVQGLSLAEADKYNRLFFETLGMSPYEPGPTGANLSAWHQRHRWAYDLATHPAIVEPITEIIGDNVVLWAMHFWYKEPGNPKFIPWHQDIHYWPMEPAVTVTAWVTLGFSLAENGCLRLIPGTHLGRADHVKLGDDSSAFGEGIDESDIDESKAVAMEMTPGQVVYFNEATFHGSKANASAIPRVAFSLRFTTPEVKFRMDEWGGDTSRLRTFLVRGVDSFRRNDGIVGTIPSE
ncbi:phytanoyl-CoA dioxygenase family protein [Cohnella zeiphila]|uniref:Phytanoyl-CoA dioxygenase family protein n=1 Tax=Cohnella zeiphila TaxID=2761120 RepID=A0A7X0SJA4_9BACL|nr:phytanoyl-CoA dioxygenase family protein [Cohnella zeiphila]MBB6730931.1 phytanoyl-CoA dioxygenase family protein [Cohnella zeiphila]